MRSEGWTKAGSLDTMRLPHLHRVKEPAMPLSHLPALLTTAFADLAHWLDRRSAARLPLLLLGILFASGRRTVTSWFRAAGITDDFRPAYATVCAVGRHTDDMAVSRPARRQAPARPASACAWPSTTPPPPRYGPAGRGRRHPPQPHPRTRRREVPLRPRLGHPGRPGQAPATGAPSPCPCRPSSTSARPTCRSCPPSARAPSAPSWRWPPSSCAGLQPWVGDRFERALGGRRWRLRQAAVPASRPGGTASRSSAACARTPPCGRCPCRQAGRASAGRQADLRQGADQPGQAGRADSAAGSRSSACSTARR